MDSSAVYIPVDRRRAIARGEAMPDRTTGAALFADISGFTQLTSALLDELGPQRGAEEVLRHINPLYDALIDRLHHYGGSVIGFAGDSITCWLDGDDGRRAIACALAMQGTMSRFATARTPAGAEIPLVIKVAIAVGPVRRFVVGDPHIQAIDVLAGATLDRMAAAESQAGKGEIVASAEVIEAAGGEPVVQVAEWRKDEPGGGRFAVITGLAADVAPLPWPAGLLYPGRNEYGLTEAQVRPWLLKPVYERLQSGSEFLSELRPVTALFLKFSGLDYDAEDAGQKLDRYIRWVQGVLGRYEGYLLQLTVGDKGSYLYAAFGAPLAHDDDPARAVVAALELQEPPSGLDFTPQVQIGVSQGRMWTGACGAQTRRTYGAMGNETNMAARLMTLAQPGQLLVTERVALAVEKSVRLNSLGPVTIKGKSRPLQLYEVLGRQAASLQRPSTLFTHPLVGRNEILASMEQTLAQARTGMGQLLQLEGQAGLGKSHLAAVFAERAVGLGWRVALGNCQSINQDSAYYPWQQIFHSLLELDESDAQGPGTAAYHVAHLERLAQEANPDWLVRLPLLGDLLGLPIPDNATTAALEPRLRQRALFALAVEMVQTWSRRQPLLLLIEDAHWMDEASLGLAQALGWAIGQLPVMLLLVHRPALPAGGEDSAGQALLPDLAGQPYIHRIDLTELSLEGIAALVAHRLQGQASPLALSLLQAKAQGNPFFVEELVDTLRESGRLRRQADGVWALSEPVFQALRDANCLVKRNGHWVLADDAPLSAVDLGIPVSIHGTVLSRIDRLPESHKLTLKAASVIGRSFEMELLVLSHPAQPERETLWAQVQEMEARDLVRLEQSRRPGTMPLYMFKHNITQEVAYETLLFAQRQQLHRAVGEALERLFSNEVEQLAYHTFLGQDWPRAVRYQLQAGEQARQLFANQQSIEYFRKALQGAENLPPAETVGERQTIHTALGELLITTGQYETALAHLHEALALARKRGDQQGQARACRWLARLYELQGEYPPALEWIQKGLLALASQETAEAVEMLLIAGLINTRQGDYDNALALCQHSLQLAEKLGELSVLARTYNLLGIITRLRGSSTDAVAYFQKSFDLYREANNIHGQALAQMQTATAYFDMSQWREADRFYRQARDIFGQLGDIYNNMAVDNNLGGIALNQGRLEDALAFYQEALEAQEQIGRSLWILGVLHMNLGHTFIRLGQAEAAREHLRTSQEYFSQAKARDFLPEMHRLFAEAALLAGELAEAESQGRLALELANEMSMRGEQGNSRRVLGEIAMAQGQGKTARQYLEDSLAILEEVNDAYEWARCQLSLARLHAWQARPELALAALESGEAVFEHLEAALDLAAARALRDEL
ncbi:MAG: tetratricopeptide repeat protein [Chloroflexi bacterium]|nr:tetratricopeptide repeat protein [Chloroflexota bacterium]MCI0578380.1 tetratricopeptide repeat protein [Chloroflexota bacterium]MCI0645396.1 tetratricopeptide repeat protein [Chloroflexota bacterium]MCI0725813.1 tetratricopeptide repeat protein [Chloroflexota bacterium]